MIGLPIILKCCLSHKQHFLIYKQSLLFSEDGGYVYMCQEGSGGSMSQIVGLRSNSYKHTTNTVRFAPGFVNYQKGALDSQPQMIKFTSCLPKAGGSLRVLRLLPPLQLVAMRCIAEILLKVTRSTTNQPLYVSGVFIFVSTILRTVLTAV